MVLLKIHPPLLNNQQRKILKTVSFVQVLKGRRSLQFFSRYKQRKLNVQKQPLSQDVPVKKGVANQGFIDHHQLDQTSPHTSSLKPLFATHSLQL